MKTQPVYLLVTPLILMMLFSSIYQKAEAITIVNTVSAASNTGVNGQNGQNGQVGTDGSRGQDGQSVVTDVSHASVSVKSVINGVTVIDSEQDVSGTGTQSVVIDLSTTTGTTDPVTISITLNNELLTANETLERLKFWQDLLTRARNLLQLYVSMHF